MPDEPDHAPHGPLPTGGTVRPMTRWGTPVMHRPQQPVTTYDDALRALAADMVATMYAADGVGLAACQIGEDVAMFVFDCPDESGERTVGVVCNPVLTLPEGRDRRLDESEEGCLSLPGFFAEVARAEWVVVEAQDAQGNPLRRRAQGLMARVFQNEVDHVNGILFIDHLDKVTRDRIKRRIRREGFSEESASHGASAL